ncbi:MAG TPA: type II secretion system F family protein [Acidimicrobiales bacterium]|nr:type II secretion system F family protein [Acidimicrobiales bacterium]
MIIASIVLATVGAVLVAAGAYDRLFAGNAAARYLASLDDDDIAEDEFAARLRQPLLHRVRGALETSVLPFLQRVTPKGVVAKAQRDLVLAGMNDVAPEELVSLQAVLGGIGVLLGIGFLMTHPSPGQALLVMLILPVAGALTPMVVVKRKAKERSEAIFKDLPDCLDLMAISVEAGVGFEAALDVVCKNFDSQLALEFRRTLKEMELGVSRREALASLRARNEVPELSNFVTALIQADALGMPIGRVLHTQAVELRNRRRQWAREKAAKLPVKILFPLVLFIFPAILVVILGPAAAAIIKGFAGS